MSDREQAEKAFVDMAHRIVWATGATVDPQNRPRTRVLHAFWEREGSDLVGWIATSPTPLKRGSLEHSPYLSLNYWAPNHDTCTADCRATLLVDDPTRVRVWERFKELPEPLGYDPAIIPPWRDGPTSDAFAALRLEPYRLRVLPGTAMTAGTGEVLTWSA